MEAAMVLNEIAEPSDHLNDDLKNTATNIYSSEIEPAIANENEDPGDIETSIINAWTELFKSNMKQHVVINHQIQHLRYIWRIGSHMVKHFYHGI